MWKGRQTTGVKRRQAVNVMRKEWYKSTDTRKARQKREFSHLKASETGKTYGKEGRQETHRERKGDKVSTLK